jgi:2-methylisocitrate lyase-like PEP mutase family enzyme
MKETAMDLNTQQQKAEAFRRMHDRSRILVLVNVWDAMSARAVEDAGARAIATSSATLAYSLGYPDGEAAPREEIAAAISRIARSIDAPLSADIESGFGRTPADVAETIRMLIDAGAVGINLEDAVHERRGELYEIPQALERIAAAREAAAKSGVPVVINARTDVFLLGVGPREERLDHAVRRANAYREAGADCLFVPAVRDAQTIGTLVSRLGGPLNVLAGPGTPPVSELERLGVARLSVGSGPGLATLTLTRKIALELLTVGIYSSFISPDTITYADANAMIKRRGPARRE